jgi:hypothetical protein
MNHQRYENGQSQEILLSAELENAWNQVHFEFARAGMAVPQEGFINRWQSRLELYRSKKNRRQALAILIVNWSVVAILVVITVLRILPSIGSPVAMVSNWIQEFASLLTFLKVIVSIVRAVNATVTSVVNVDLWAWGAVGLAAVCVLWVVTFRRYALQQGVVR